MLCVHVYVFSGSVFKFIAKEVFDFIFFFPILYLKFQHSDYLVGVETVVIEHVIKREKYFCFIGKVNFEKKNKVTV